MEKPNGFEGIYNVTAVIAIVVIRVYASNKRKGWLVDNKHIIGGDKYPAAAAEPPH